MNAVPIPAKIAVLEDDKAVRSVFTATLERAGYDVSGASTLQEAIELLEDDRFSMLICDLSVIGRDRIFDFADALHTTYPETAMLIVTGFTPTHIVHEAHKHGVTVLEKPFNPGDLIRRIKLILQQRTSSAA
jgi:DNA-binding NtrC family response regulator